MKSRITKIGSILLATGTCILLACNTNRKSNPSTALMAEYAIAYNVLVDEENDNYEVFSMNMDGSEKKNLTKLGGVEWNYYSYQDKLYFISDKDTCQRCSYYLYETNFKGENPRKVSAIPLADSWMSSRNNGTQFIVRPHTQIDSSFYIIDLRGNLIQKLEPHLPYASDPLFVNNGQQVVFRGGHTKSKLVDGFDEALYIIDSNGKNRRRLTHYPKGDTTAGKFGFRAGTPKLHPTENFISYQSKQNGKYSLYATTLDGSKQWKLTENLENEGWHEWSPDGKWLAIEIFDDHQTQFHIALMHWETKKMKVLTDTTYQYQQAPNFVLKTSNNR